jgi:diadenosine tetraphosphate (Ap4A) HIT family hydrolase
VVGDVNGQFRAVFQKLGALHSKNAFAFALVVGNLFADPEISTDEDDQEVQELLVGKIGVSLPIYFALRSHALPAPVVEKLQSSDGELCPNLYYLGNRTTTKTSDGVRVVALGGMLDTNVAADSKDKYLPFYTEQDAKILKGANHANILVTSQWPSGIRTGSNASLGDHEEPTSQHCIAELNDVLRPRYHFSASPNFFYEREPFFHAPKEDAPGEYHTTRFISLAAYNNPSKSKWIYAFSLDPSIPPATSVSPGTTASPFTLINKKRAPLPDQNSYRFSTSDSYERPRKRHKNRDKAPPPTQGECYFCLSNPNLPTHLITSIGTEAYLTTAKGPLTTSTTFPSLSFPSHILIIPMTHAPTLSLIPDAEARANTRTEMTKYRQGIQTMLATTSQNALGAITWEISRASGFHTHWQILPMPQNLISKKLVEAALKVEAENKSHPHLEKGDPGESVDYFRIWIFDAQTKEEKSLHFSLDAGFRDLQYARRVAAKLLGLEGRIMWQDCGQTEAEETKDAEGFKEAFKAFDFTEQE